MAEVQKLCAERKIVWREHALRRMKERGIKREDIKYCLAAGESIERYPEDYPSASCLILGIDNNGKFLHIVCSIYEEMVCMITAYYPNHIKWEVDLKTRKAVE